MADYAFQNDFIAKYKGKNLIILFTHAGIWTGCIAIAGHLIGMTIDVYDVMILFVVHSIADYLKASNKLWYKNMDDLKEGLVIDQSIHVVQILVLMITN